jgi:16S rRNA (adenine1518-N6/adenine1519-N6)-dimethyltransferase
MTPAELRGLLARHGIRAVHGRGQNFLADDRVLSAIVEGAGVKPGDQVLEIGPGPGALTEKLLDAGATVVAVELDARFRPLLEGRFAGRTFTLVAGDFLEQNRRELLAYFPQPAGSYKVVANIPYYLTSKIIQNLLREAPKPVLACLMVQKEVGERLTARPGKMSSIAVYCQIFAEISKIISVGRTSFQPPPKVDSVVLRLDVKSDVEVAEFFQLLDEDSFFRLVQACFTQKRKKIRNLLPFPAAESEHWLLAAGISPDVRPETLSVDDWRRLAGAVLRA